MQALHVSHGSASLFGNLHPSLGVSRLEGTGVFVLLAYTGIYFIDSSFSDLSNAAVSNNAFVTIFNQVQAFALFCALCAYAVFHSAFSRAFMHTLMFSILLSSLRSFLCQMSRVRMQGGGVYVRTLAVSFDAHNVSFARISMYSNSTLSYVAGGGIVVDVNGQMPIFNMTGCSFVNITHAAVGPNCSTFGTILL